MESAKEKDKRRKGSSQKKGLPTAAGKKREEETRGKLQPKGSERRLLSPLSSHRMALGKVRKKSTQKRAVTALDKAHGR